MTMVTISDDQDCEMLRITVDGSMVFEGNYWDFGPEVMGEILTKAGIVCEEDTYEYEYE